VRPTVADEDEVKPGLKLPGSDRCRRSGSSRMEWKQEESVLHTGCLSGSVRGIVEDGGSGSAAHELLGAAD
jgi:hypothetical protein